jgi:tagatose 6-phosphate kinase
VITVVALNPALDVTHHVNAVDWAGVNRPVRVHTSAGGKGLNVARTLHSLDENVMLLGLAGGDTGAAVQAGLDAAGVPAVLTPIGAPTRRTFAVVDATRHTVAIFNEPGPPITGAEYDKFRASYEEALHASSAVVLSGSLPPGLPASTYADLIRAAADAGVPSLLDTSGEPLRLGVAAGPAVVKPNLAELAAVTGARVIDPPVEVADDSDLTPILKAAGELRAGSPTTVVVSMGPAGLLVDAGQDRWLAVPEPVTGNPTGAGDAAMAGLARGLVLHQSWPDILREATALGAATTAAPAAGEFTRYDYLQALRDVRVLALERV